MLEIEAYGVPTDALEDLQKLPGVREAAVEERGQVQVVTVQSDADADVQADVLRRLNGVRIGRVTSREPTLEDAYVAIIAAASRVAA